MAFLGGMFLPKFGRVRLHPVPCTPGSDGTCSNGRRCEAFRVFGASFQSRGIAFCLPHPPVNDSLCYLGWLKSTKYVNIFDFKVVLCEAIVGRAQSDRYQKIFL